MSQFLISPIKYHLADELKDATQSLHRAAESQGVVADIIKRRASRARYILFLRNLLPVYQAIEKARHSKRLDASGLLQCSVLRSESIQNDLMYLYGQNFEQHFPVLPSTEIYVSEIDDIIENNPVTLVGHVYVRYLGDMHGGQILQRLIGESFCVGEKGLSFYRFEQIKNIKAFRAHYRLLFDSIKITPAEKRQIIECGVAGFEHNIALSTDANAAVLSQHQNSATSNTSILAATESL